MEEPAPIEVPEEPKKVVSPPRSPKRNPLANVAAEVLAPAHETHPDLKIDVPIEDAVFNIAGGDSPTAS